MIDKDTIISRNEDAVFRVIDNEAVVVESLKGMVTVLNETGCRIWELIDGVRTLGAVAAIIEQEFDVSAEQALVDTTEFLSELARNDLIR